MDDYNESLGEEHWGVFAFQILAIPPKEYLKKGVPPKSIASGEVIARDDEEARVLALLKPHKDYDQDEDATTREERIEHYLNANEAYSRLAVPMLDAKAGKNIDDLFDTPRARIQVHVARKG